MYRVTLPYDVSDGSCARPRYPHRPCRRLVAEEAPPPSAVTQEEAPAAPPLSSPPPLQPCACPAVSDQSGASPQQRCPLAASPSSSPGWQSRPSPRCTASPQHSPSGGPSAGTATSSRRLSVSACHLLCVVWCVCQGIGQVAAEL